MAQENKSQENLDVRKDWLCCGSTDAENHSPHCHASPCPWIHYGTIAEHDAYLKALEGK